jgi:hypothetical protein
VAQAHGKLADALANGGCGHLFMWDTLKPAKTYVRTMTYYPPSILTWSCAACVGIAACILASAILTVVGARVYTQYIGLDGNRVDNYIGGIGTDGQEH